MALGRKGVKAADEERGNLEEMEKGEKGSRV